MTDLKSTVADLRAKAEAATPGPWETEEIPAIDYRPTYIGNPDSRVAFTYGGGPRVAIDKAGERRNAAFIAAANPVAILTILDALDEARGKVDRLTDENEELRNAPWPEWAKKVVATIRAHSGYDGSDDAIDGIDMPQELGEILDEYDGQIKHKDAELATLRAEVERLTEINKDLFDGTYRIANRWYEQNEELAALRTKRHATRDQKLASLAKTLAERDAELATLRAEVERLRSLGWQMDQRGISGRITPPEAMP